MKTRTKVLIGTAAAVAGGVLCYFYCPCFKKGKTAPVLQSPSTSAGTPVIQDTSGVPAARTPSQQGSGLPQVASTAVYKKPIVIE